MNRLRSVQRRWIAALCLGGIAAIGDAVSISAPLAGTGWPPDPTVNVAINDTIGEQIDPVLVADAGGGVFCLWRDEDWNRRIVRLNASGSVEAGWPARGIVLTASGVFGSSASRSGPDAVIVCWHDNSEPTLVRAQKLDTSAVLHWPTPGVVVNSRAISLFETAVALPDGGAMVFMRTTFGFTTDTAYVMRIDGAGQRVWPQELVLCDAVGTQEGFKALAVSDSEVIVMWRDGRTTPLFLDPQERELYAQKLKLDGTEMWGHNGIRILSAQTYSAYPLPNGAGGFVATCGFSPTSTRGDLKLVNIGPDGSPMPGWPTDGLVIANDPDAREGGLPSVSPSDGSILLVWGDAYSLSRLRALKISPTGDILWPNGGIALFDTTALLAGWSIAPDGEGGAFVAIEYPLTDTNIIAQHVHADGSFAWPGWGVPVTSAPGVQYVSYTEPDASGGIFVAWRDYRNPATDPDLYAQHVNADGSLGGVVTATEAAAIEAVFEEGCARIAWYVSDAAGVEFSVQRSTDGTGWLDLGTAGADGTGRIVHRDCDVRPGASYSYRLEWSVGGETHHSAPITLTIDTEPRLALAPPAPNPLAERTSFEFTLPRAGLVRLEVLDLAGRRVAMPLDATRGPGTHRFAWEARDREGRRLAPGCYLLRMSVPGESLTRRFVVLR